LSALSASTLGTFRGTDAVSRGVSRRRLADLCEQEVIERVLPDTYRMTAVMRSTEQDLVAALLWAGPGAAATGRSAAELFRLEGVRAEIAEIAVVDGAPLRSNLVEVHYPRRSAAMVRDLNGVRVTGIEYTLVRLAATLEPEAFEIALEDARRRRLTSIPALRAYLKRFGRSGREGVRTLRLLLAELDPAHPARSTLEVKTRRLLVANGITNFVRELPLKWEGDTYFFDFAFVREQVVLEANGRRWHDDVTDYERNNDKWSVPGHHGYRVMFATWSKVTQQPERLVADLRALLRK
jgi:very-short-patch-repair endonuclease